MRRILVVDDDPIILGLLRDFFASDGYDVLCLEKAVDAVYEIGKEPFDMVITDYSMPGMNGIELTRCIRHTWPTLPVIGMSASGDEETFKLAGADYFVSKPFDLVRLKKIVENSFKGDS